MRIWDLAPRVLCRQHLLGEHRALYALWTILTEGKGGYARHPGTRRWHGKLTALYSRHEALVTIPAAGSVTTSWTRHSARSSCFRARAAPVP
jgi:hypothetical protein